MRTLSAVLSEPAAIREAGITAEAFEEIIRQHQRKVYRVISLLLKDTDAADALTQECFLRAYQKRHTFRGESKIQTWLLRIAVNLANDHARNRRASFWRRFVRLDSADHKRIPSPSVRIASPQASPERMLLAREELKAVWSAMASLSEQQRTIFLLRFGEDMSLQEVARLLGKKVGTVKVHLFRAIRKVREVMREKQWR
jgi:RNA polymerase sigma-70 factor (ECF subfamily)